MLFLPSKSTIVMKSIKTLIYVCISTLFLFAACTKPTGEKPEEIPDYDEKAELNEQIAAKIPHIYITTEGGAPVVSKEIYLNGEVEINGNGVQMDFIKTKTRIKGRGNSTWVRPKKPYRLKLDVAASIFGLPAAKDWVLLANHIDYTLMCNAVAMKIGQQLNMPFTNSIIPVDLTLNGVYMGNYTLTQQMEAKPTRIDVGEGGVLLEMDSYFDEDFKFKSAGLSLPVMIKSPDITSDAQFEKIKKEFEDFEKLIVDSKFPNTNYGNVFDKQQLVNYLIVNNLTGNFEINHPKSVYMHKKANGKYTMGPIWDFDYGFGFDEVKRSYFNFIEFPLLKTNDTRPGYYFYTIFLKDPEIRQLYKTTWSNFKSNQFDKLLTYIEEYAASIRESKKKDYELWKVGSNDLPTIKRDLKLYLHKRARYIDQYLSTLK